MSTALPAQLLQLIVNKGVLSQHTISDCLATGRKITSPTLSAIITQRERYRQILKVKDTPTRFSDTMGQRMIKSLLERAGANGEGHNLSHRCALMKYNCTCKLMRYQYTHGHLRRCDSHLKRWNDYAARVFIETMLWRQQKLFSWMLWASNSLNDA